MTKEQLRFKIRMAAAGISSSLKIDAQDDKRSTVTKDDLTSALVFITQADDILTKAIKRPRK